jgi:DNA-binding response OmpR family regulator
MSEDKKRLLVVEDDTILQRALQDFLTSEGFEIFVASDGEVGISTAKEKIPDLVLLDIILPKKDGYEVLAALKNDEKTKNIPIILLTNLGSLNDVEKAIELGATTYLVKSDYKLEEVAKKIKETLKMV